MQCFVYKCSRKAGAYLYLLQKDDFSEVPEELLKKMGDLSLALTFEFHADRKLAQANPAVVRAGLEDRGYHLQLAPSQHSLLLQLPNSQLPSRLPT